MPEHDPPPDNLRHRFRTAVLTDHLIPPQSTVLVGVSGRADSVALVHLLHELRNDLAVRLMISHIPSDAGPSETKPERFVRELAQQLSVSYVRADTLDDEKAAPTARLQRRLATLERMKVHVRASTIAIGETSDDVAELFLTYLVRADDTLGESPLLTNETLVRPLLSFTHAEILGFLTEHQIPFLTDQGALSLSSLERKIRLLILPLLQRHIAGRAVTHLAVAAQDTLDDRRFIEEVARAARAEVGWMEHAGSLTLDHARWSALPASLRRRVLHHALGTLAGASAITHADLHSLDIRCRYLTSGETIGVGTLKITRSEGMLTAVQVK